MVLAGALIVAALWLHFAGPCEWYAWAAVKDVPVRCIDHFTLGGAGGR